MTAATTVLAQYSDHHHDGSETAWMWIPPNSLRSTESTRYNQIDAVGVAPWPSRRLVFLLLRPTVIDVTIASTRSSPIGGARKDFRRGDSVLVVAFDPDQRQQLAELVETAGCLAECAASQAEALELFRAAPPDLVLYRLPDSRVASLELLERLRDEPDRESVPVVCLTPRNVTTLTVQAFGRRADDVVPVRTSTEELTARIAARLERRPTPRSSLKEDPITGALTPDTFAEQLRRELERVERGGRAGAVAYLALDELPGLEARLGSRARDEVVAQVVSLIKEDSRTLDFIGFSRNLIVLLMPGTPRRGVQVRLDRLSRLVHDTEFRVQNGPLRLTPIIGWTETMPGLTMDEVEDRAWTAMAHEAEQLDLHPTRWVCAMTRDASDNGQLSALRRILAQARTPLQVLAQLVLVVTVPFVVYTVLDRAGADISGVAYLLIVSALTLTAAAIWIESRAARHRPEPPAAPPGPPPPATAVIAAYLPNEADTILDTVDAFLAQDYPDLQVIVAYNTPHPLPVEDDLRAIADRDSRFVAVRVEGSVSKAQNVNAALAHVRGEFVGLFDADHHPAPGSFQRAWRWIASGVGVVQGHCVVRNGSTNTITKLVAAEFESIYAVSHPGRAHLHGFGIFGGSNGYWRTSLLRRTRMRGFMLTEDIDSSMRVMRSGEQIVSDPNLVSTELAPETVGALWNQRARWAQGWSQVSLRHLRPAFRSAPTLRQRFGLAYLLGWREVYPWVSLQMLPLLLFWWDRGEPPMNWFVPIFVVTSLFTLSAGPTQAWFAWRLGHPSIRSHTGWFVWFLVASLVFYTEAKNVVARTAHIKELMRERAWKVTPRSAVAAGTGADSEAASTGNSVAEVAGGGAVQFDPSRNDSVVTAG